MKNNIFLLIICFLYLTSNAIAGHVAGGEMYYTYLGKGIAPNTSKYQITLRLFRECNPVAQGGVGLAQLPPEVYMGIYKNSNPSTRVGDLVFVKRKGNISILNLSTYDPCLTDKVPVCYQIALYEFQQELPDIPEGYVIGYQTCCRSNSIVNIEFFDVPSGPQIFHADGATYTCEIPGTNILGTETNSSPIFHLKDTVLVCANSNFKVDFSASDPDVGDSISYALCSAFDRGGTTNSADTNYSMPPYNTVTYLSSFSGSQPLGANAVIDPITGLIHGIAPAIGAYVVNVCATEWRNGRVLSTHRKDFTLKVTSCSLNAADLKPAYVNCNDLNFTFFNDNPSSDIVSYLWTFGDTATKSSDTSTKAVALHSFSDTGVYKVTLMVQSKGGCVDSAKSLARVYPGFRAKFAIKSSCIKNPYYFSDSTYSKYGRDTIWHWDFGEPNVLSDTSNLKNPTYIYPTTGTKTVTLKVIDNNGCTDSIQQMISVKGNPDLILPNKNKDTLICKGDTLQLLATLVNPSGTPIYSWSPRDSIINPDSPTPKVHPKNTATYYVLLTDDGCVANDSITIKTVPQITVKASPDTSICLSDSIQLQAISHGNGFAWSSSTGEKIDSLSNPFVKPTANPTLYYIQANLGMKCFARDTTSITVHPYPIAKAGSDEAVCFKGQTQLHASIIGNTFSWYPTASLNDSTTLSPIVTPDTSENYILTVYYTQKNTCPKPVKDTVRIIVFPEIILSSVKDTAVVYNEPLQLKVTGNIDSNTTIYQWRNIKGGEDYLNKTTIFNPIAIYPIYVDSVTYQVMAIVNNSKQCFALDTIKVIVFKTPPDIFVPNAFTPNNDGENDIARPIPIGVLNLDFFSIYNRMGQQLYTTSQIGQGWDGTYKGVNQPSGTYVYMVQGTNYLGTKVFHKGTVVLIR